MCVKGHGVSSASSPGEPLHPIPTDQSHAPALSLTNCLRQSAVSDSPGNGGWLGGGVPDSHTQEGWVPAGVKLERALPCREMLVMPRRCQQGYHLGTGLAQDSAMKIVSRALPLPARGAGHLERLPDRRPVGCRSACGCQERDVTQPLGTHREQHARGSQGEP